MNPTDSGVIEGLEPCPFCGEAPGIETGVLKMFRVACRAAICKVWPTTPWYREKDVVVRVWNTRVRASVAAPPGDALAELLTLFEKDGHGRWCFKSLSRDDSKFDKIMDRLTAVAPSTTQAGEVSVLNEEETDG